MTTPASPLEQVFEHYLSAERSPPFKVVRMANLDAAETYWRDQIARADTLEGPWLIPILRLLEMNPDTDDTTWDNAFVSAFEAMPDDLVWYEPAFLFYLTDAVHEDRWPRLLGALATRVVDSLIDDSARLDVVDHSLVFALQPAVGEAALLRARQILAQSPAAPNHRARARSAMRLLALIYEGAPTPEDLDPLICEAIIGVSDAVAMDDDLLISTVRPLPQPRMEAILLGAPRFPWWGLSLRPSPAIMTRAVDIVARATAGTNTVPWVAALSKGDALARDAIEPVLSTPPKGTTFTGRLALMTALARVAGPSSGPVVLGALREESLEMQRLAEAALASFGPDGGLPFVAQALGDPMPRVRRASARILARWVGHQKAEALALDRLTQETDPEVIEVLEAMDTPQTSVKPPTEAIDALLAAVNLTGTDMRSWQGIRGWQNRLGEGMPFAAHAFVWLTQVHLWSYHHPRHMWFSILKHNRGERLTPWMALRGLELELGMTQAEYIAKIDEIMGSWLLQPSLHALGSGHKSRQAIYSNLLDNHENDIDMAVHVEQLQDSSERVRSLAISALAKLGEPAIASVLPLLGARKAAVRGAAASCLGFIGHESALAPLKAAVEAERSEKTKAVLQKARDACDPVMRHFAGGGRSAGDLYDLGEPLEANEGLALLRALVYEAPSQETWVRICNTLERLSGSGADALAVSYLMDHNIQSWEPHLKPTPTHWPDDSAFQTLAPQKIARVWAPIHAFVGKKGANRLKKALKPLEKGTRSRRFKMGDLAPFLATVERTWRWCEQNGLPASNVEVRYDGGCGYSDNAPTTVVTLWFGVGVLFERKRGGSSRQPSGLRHVRAKIPKGHALGLQHPLDSQRRLDVLPLMGLEEGS